MKSDTDIFLEYSSIYEKAVTKENANDIVGALDLYLYILENYAPVGISYYERPAILLEKSADYSKALFIYELALNNLKRFNTQTRISIKKTFSKRKERLLKKINKTS